MVIMPGIPTAGSLRNNSYRSKCRVQYTLGVNLIFAMYFSSGGEEEAASLVVLIGIGSGVEAIRSITFVVVSGLELEIGLLAFKFRLPEKI